MRTTTTTIVRGAWALGVVALSVPAGGAGAAVISISSSLVGGYNAAGGYENTLAFQNYFTGSTATGPQPDRRSFFLFSLPAVLPGPVVSASFTIRNPWLPFPGGATGTPGYFSDDPFETFRLSDTPFPAAAIASPHTVPEALAIWATLGTGELYGTADVTPAPGPLTDITITLSPAAIASINASLGDFFVMGGQITTLDGSSPDELIFGYSDIPSPHIVEPTLELTFVPAPGSAALLVGAAGAWIRRRRR